SGEARTRTSSSRRTIRRGGRGSPGVETADESGIAVESEAARARARRACGAVMIGKVGPSDHAQDENPMCGPLRGASRSRTSVCGWGPEEADGLFTHLHGSPSLAARTFFLRRTTPRLDPAGVRARSIP